MGVSPSSIANPAAPPALMSSPDYLQSRWHIALTTNANTMYRSNPAVLQTQSHGGQGCAIADACFLKDAVQVNLNSSLS